MMSKKDARPLGGYTVMMALYSAVTGGAVLALRGRSDRLRWPRPMDLVLLGLATQHLSRLISKDGVTAPLRAPFTEFEEPAGEGEVNERVVGTGMRHAVGELLSCPFCLDQWVATGLVAGYVASPTLATAAITTLATAQAADYLQLVYGILRNQQ